MSNQKTQFGAQNAKRLRAEMVAAERKLWTCLRNRGLMGLEFERQQPIGPYIADFACREADLVIELDSGQHAGSSRDTARTRVLKQHGYDVIRFWNNDVLQNLDDVLQTLADRLTKAERSPEGRGEDGLQIPGRPQ